MGAFEGSGVGCDVGLDVGGGEVDVQDPKVCAASAVNSPPLATDVPLYSTSYFPVPYPQHIPSPYESCCVRGQKKFIISHKWLGYVVS